MIEPTYRGPAFYHNPGHKMPEEGLRVWINAVECEDGIYTAWYEPSGPRPLWLADDVDEYPAPLDCLTIRNRHTHPGYPK